jgi:hypothetical protein
LLKRSNQYLPFFRARVALDVDGHIESLSKLRVLPHGLRLIDLVYALFFLGCAVEGQ